MPRVKDQTLHELLAEIDPRKVAEIVDGYGLGVARERWHWAYAHIPQLAVEGRRMKAAGERWVRRARPPEPVEELSAPVLKPAPAPAPVAVAKPLPKHVHPAQPPRDSRLEVMSRRIVDLEANVAALTERLAALESRNRPSAEILPFRPAAPAWDFPLSPEALTKALRRMSVRMLAMTYRTSQRRIRELAAEADRLTKRAA